MISRWDYATGFALDNALRDRLRAASEFANTHMAHLNADRVPTAASPITQTPSRSTLVRHADDVFDAMDALVQHLVTEGSVFAADFQEFLAGAQSRRDAGDPAADIDSVGEPPLTQAQADLVAAILAPGWAGTATTTPHSGWRSRCR